MRSRLAAAATLALLALPLTNINSAHATPQGPVNGGQNACDGATCRGLEPARTISSIDHQPCTAGAYTPRNQYGPARVATTSGIVQLLYSPHCHANWARIDHATPGSWVWVQNQNNQYQQAYVPSGQTTTHTAMINGNVLARAGSFSAYTAWY
ncbi:Protein of unknown function [Streptomyces sp. 2231.1]|uniref:DUF2690 domain-containing protein n=1 Tax=Streptomyces sp. 2231.1 TaxID=1855347 RepID=UPI000898B265|nr:Protein of unknown function [Streptomyces sp. 2231.1]